MKTMTCAAAENSVGSVLDFIEGELKKYGASKKETAQAMLISEECFVNLIRNSADGESITLKIGKSFGKVVLKAEAKGQQIDVKSIYSSVSLSDFDEIDEKTEFAIRSILLRHYSERIRNSYKAGINHLSVILKTDTYHQTKLTAVALLLAIIVGAAMRLLVPEAGQALNTYLFSPISSIFMRCMKCIVGPIVFVSILNSIIGFDDMRVLGRIGAKVMGFYTLTSVIAIAVGYACSVIISPGEFGSMTLAAVSEAAEVTQTNFVDTVVSFFSTNVVASFFDNDTIQIIVIALFCGIALNEMGERNSPIRNGVNALNEMITLIASEIAKAIPGVVFCSIASMVLTLKAESMLSILYMVLTVFIGYIIMLVVYSILMLVVGRVNPLIMLKKYIGTALTVMSLSSSNASIPMNLDFAKRIGVSGKICSFSIPLGATVNMDGACIYFIIATLFIAKVYGCTFTAVGLAQLFLLVLVISLGTPGIPGGAAALMIPLLSVCGLPAEAALIIVGVDSIVDMVRTALNTTGDQVVTLSVAAGEKLLDREKYHSKDN